MLPAYQSDAGYGGYAPAYQPPMQPGAYPGGPGFPPSEYPPSFGGGQVTPFDGPEFEDIGMAKEETADPVDDEELVTRCRDWRWQVTPRMLILATLLSGLVCFIQLQFGVSGTGVSPGFSVISSVLGYCSIKFILWVVMRCFHYISPYTKQENSCLQTICTAVTTCAFGMGYTSWLHAMNIRTAYIVDAGLTYEQYVVLQAAGTLPVVTNTITLNYATHILLTFLMGFTGSCIVFIFRKPFILDMKLPYPSAVATGVLINSLFDSKDAEDTKVALGMFYRWLGGVFCFSALTWVFSGTGNGLSAIPFLGITAWQQGWVLNLEEIKFIGAGSIMNRNVNYSIAIGAALWFGLVARFVYATGGECPEGVCPDGVWFDETESGLEGYYGYKIMFAVMVFMGDGVYPLFMMAKIGVNGVRNRNKPQEEAEPVDVTDQSEAAVESRAQEHQTDLNNRVFQQNPVPNWVVAALYLVIVIASTIVLPIMYPEVLWYLIILAYILVVPFSVMGNYIAGLTDWNLTSNFAKLAVLIFSVASEAIKPGSGIVGGLMACGVVYGGASISVDTMADIKTGYMTMTSPRAIAICQVYGIALGAFIAPLVFGMLESSQPDFGWPSNKETGRNSVYPNTYNQFYRQMSTIGALGFGALGKNCLLISGVLFFIAMVSPFLKAFVTGRLAPDSKALFWVTFLWPNMSCIALPILTGTYWVIPVIIGWLIMEVWEYRNKASYVKRHQMWAAAIIVGCGMWTVMSTIFALADVSAPMNILYGANGRDMPMVQEPWS